MLFMLLFSGLFRLAVRVGRGLASLAATPVFFGRALDNVPAGALVFCPVRPNLLFCGLAGLVACKRPSAASDAVDLDGMARDVAKVEGLGLSRCVVCGTSLKTDYLGGELLGGLYARLQRFKAEDGFFALYGDGASQGLLEDWGKRLALLAENEATALYSGAFSVSGEDVLLAAERIELLRDTAWCMTAEVLKPVARVRELAGEKPNAGAVSVFQRLDAVLANIDRLEVRGRDSAGVTLLFFLSEQNHALWMEGVEALGLGNRLAERISREVLVSKVMSVTRKGDLWAVSFTFKTAAEIGSLGDNVAALRKEIAADRLLKLIAARPNEYFTILSHTRWASVGAITQPNCHPVDNAVTGRKKGEGGVIFVGLNGDIDNYAELLAAYEAEAGVRVSPEITTDTKIIPIQIQKHLDRGSSVIEAFRLAVNDFHGSHAIFMMTDLAPGKLFLAQKGSGQTLFVGIGESGFVPTSEVYGFVEQTSRFIKMAGEKVVETAIGKSQGQILVLDQEKPGLAGIEAIHYNGEKIAFSEADLQKTGITSRDTDRGGFPHYFLKEISQSPDSVKKTLLNRWRVEGQGDQKRVTVDLTERQVPEKIRQALVEGQIRKVAFIGQGTAGVAALVCADVFRHYLKDRMASVTALKASEFSGFAMNGDDAENFLSDTLLVAITQSGTTTDTNRAVDMARARGAYSLCIVNRRDSDITFKTDGVIYTSSGRDIEMSVASTKAFYSQIVAGTLLGLFCARITGVRDDAFIAREVGLLLDLPDAMRKVLALHDTIAASAKRLAPTRTYWAVVGSGPNKAASDEIRIKLSELCYKTISSDYVEDKKHIDLSSEPLIIVCAAGSPEAVLGDVVKDTAIFKAHKAAPVVIADEGETRFDGVALDVIPVPSMPSHLAAILNTLAGHVWGYNAALAINEGSRFLYEFREDLGNTVETLTAQGLDVYEILLEKSFRERILKFYGDFRSAARPFPEGVCGSIPADLFLLCKYLTGRLPDEDFFLDFGIKGTPSNKLSRMFETLGRGIALMARPVDAIKHQAKTVTVGTSRMAETLEGLLFDVIRGQGFAPDQLKTANVLVLKNVQKVLDRVVGLTLYKIGGLSLLGETVDSSTISLVKKEGTAAGLVSRVETDNRLQGTKRIIVARGNVYLGKGRKDQRSILAIPLIAGSGPSPNAIAHLLLLEVAFKADVSRKARAQALGGKYEHIKNLVAESNFPWDDSHLDLVSISDLFGRSAEKISEIMVEELRKK